MGKESAVKRKEPEEEGFSGTPLTSKISEKIESAKKVVSIMLTDRGLYENAQKRLKEIYNGAVSKIRRLFRRK